MIPTIDIAVTDASQVGEARRAALRIAADRAFDETACGRIALIVTELGTNLVRHAKAGRLLIDCRDSAGERRIDILSMDSGPGMADVGRCLRDGYSSGGTPGNGLGAVQRLSTDFSVFSAVGEGTVILSRTRAPAPGGPQAPPHFAYAGLCLAVSGETISGDAWDIRLDAGRAAVIVADGLGHGPAASEASGAALATFAAARGSPSAVLERAHAAMRATRGAAVAIAEVDALAATVLFAGAGNIAGRMISGIEDRVLMSQHGTLGVQIRKLQDAPYAWPEHALIVLHSDGLTTRWNLKDAGGLLRCDPAVVAGWLLRDHARGRDDATVVVLKRV
ncbi:MAG: ATP-binding protein [Burkholderiaceae bacterium]